MFRFALPLLTALATPSAIFAVTAAGPHPYYCFVSAICDGEGNCLSPTGVPTKFLAVQVSSYHGDTYLFEGYGGNTTRAVLFDDTHKAKSFTAATSSDFGFDAVAIRRKDIADGVGFIVHEVSFRANKREISSNATLVRCSSLSDGLY